MERSNVDIKIVMDFSTHQVGGDIAVPSDMALITSLQEDLQPQVWRDERERKRTTRTI